MSGNVEIVEVSPRDGLQSESKILSTAAKVSLIEKTIEASLVPIKVTNFVNSVRVS